MTDGAPTPGASEGDQTPAVTPAGGASDSGAAGGSQEPTADAFAAERATLESQRRALQSERDQLKAENEKLKKPEPAAQATDEGTPPLSAEGVMALLKRDRELTAAAAELKEAFPMADPALFQGYERFENADAFKAAVETDHTRVKTLLETHAEPLVQERLKPYVEKYGEIAQTPADNQGGTNAGLPSAQEVAGYSQAQMNALVAQHGPDVIDRILRSAN